MKMIDPAIIRRKNLPRASFAAELVLKRKRKSKENIDPEGKTHADTTDSTNTVMRGRCQDCRNENKYRKKCARCDRFVCGDHSTLICLHCE